ncbi:hypothetical protein B0H14DRAFT_2572252 [Mycena olivaceomarginata]|nr:hypothetical protein B0H14DRAFT_2572252 [Mycena olivaceomarginata]
MRFHVWRNRGRGHGREAAVRVEAEYISTLRRSARRGEEHGRTGELWREKHRGVGTTRVEAVKRLDAEAEEWKRLHGSVGIQRASMRARPGIPLPTQSSGRRRAHANALLHCNEVVDVQNPFRSVRRPIARVGSLLRSRGILEVAYEAGSRDE